MKPILAFTFVSAFFMDNQLKKGRFTEHSNRIGLYDDARRTFLAQSGEVVLSFPFRDCVLEGGMSSEETGREEKFFHETIDKSDIDTLREKKVLTGFRRIDASGEHILTSPDEVSFFDADGNLTENLLIKGNNLIALYTLQERLAGKVKLIYIDPPYNTGNDGFRYNDNFNHSTWLVFMRNRLEAAKELLRDDGVIFVQCDDNEQAYLKVLMDEVFGRENFVNCVVVKMSEASGVKMAHIDKKLAKIKEYLLVFSKSDNLRFNPIKIMKENSGSKLDDYLKYYKKILINPEEEIEKWIIVSIDEYLKMNGLPRDGLSVRKFQLENASRIIYRTNNASFENLIINKPLAKIISKTGKEYIWWEGKQMLFLADYIDEYLCDLWLNISTINLNKEGYVDLKNGKKPEILIQNIVELSTKPGDIVLDFCLGSGTTAAVAHKMSRRWIGIEQMDYIEDIAKVRIKKVIDGEQGGVSKSVGWTGGGSCVYLELKTYNIEFQNRIENTSTKEELEGVYRDMRANAFLIFWFDRRDFEREGYKGLLLTEQKIRLREILDLNHLYLNYLDMNDAHHRVTDIERSLTDHFYGKKAD